MDWVKLTYLVWYNLFLLFLSMFFGQYKLCLKYESAKCKVRQAGHWRAEPSNCNRCRCRRYSQLIRRSSPMWQNLKQSKCSLHLDEYCQSVSPCSFVKQLIWFLTGVKSCSSKTLNKAFKPLTNRISCCAMLCYFWNYFNYLERWFE